MRSRGREPYYANMFDNFGHKRNDSDGAVVMVYCDDGAGGVDQVHEVSGR